MVNRMCMGRLYAAIFWLQKNKFQIRTPLDSLPRLAGDDVRTCLMDQPA